MRRLPGLCDYALDQVCVPAMLYGSGACHQLSGSEIPLGYPAGSEQAEILPAEKSGASYCAGWCSASAMERKEQTMRAGWANDPVHPNGHIYAKMALNLIEKIAPASNVPDTSATGSRKRTWSASNREEIAVTTDAAAVPEAAEPAVAAVEDRVIMTVRTVDTAVPDPLVSDQVTTKPPSGAPAGNPEEKAATAAATAAAAAATAAAAAATAATAAMKTQENEAEEAAGVGAAAAGSAATPAEAAFASTNPPLSLTTKLPDNPLHFLIRPICASHSNT
jgi:hypothetical protein